MSIAAQSQGIFLKQHYEEFIRANVDASTINPMTYERARFACINVLKQIDATPRVKLGLENMNEAILGLLEHSYMTAFVSAMLIQNISWNTVRTSELAVFGALVHDVGMSKLPPEILAKPLESLTPQEFEIYQTHPRLSAEMIRDWQLPEPVAQVALQHHELNNSAGYPLKTSAAQIYPLAKIVSLGNSFAEILLNEKIPMVQALKAFASNPQILRCMTVMRSGR